MQNKDKLGLQGGEGGGEGANIVTSENVIVVISDHPSHIRGWERIL